MAKLSKTTASVGGTKLTELGQNLLATNESELKQAAPVGNIIGLESFSDAKSSITRETLETKLGDKIRQGWAASTQGTALEDLTDAQVEAGAIIAMASGNPVAYAEKAMSNDFPALESHDSEGPVVNNGSAGEMDQGMDPIALEYFTEQSLDKHMAASFRFNMQAARQDNFAETIMPTIVADPTEAGLLIEIKKTMVHRAVRHAVRSKDSRPFNRRNILDGATDASVLEDKSIAFVPYMLEDGANSSNFVSTDLMQPVAKEVGDYTVNTNPLAFGSGKKNLLELSAHTGLVSSGILDESDELSGRVELETLYFTIGKKGGKKEDLQIFSVKTANTARSTFNKSQEGDGMELELSYVGSTFSLSSGTEDVAGAPLLALDEVASNKYQLNFTVEVRNRLNIQTGVESSLVGAIEILNLMNEARESISVASGQGKSIVDAIEILPVGYVYKAARSNANRRTKGILVDSVVERERYKIQLGSPITSRKPIGRTDNSQAIEDLITAARIRNSNQAVTKILNVTETLKDVVASIGAENEYQVPSIEGVGRHYVRPWFDEKNIIVGNVTAARETKDQDENLAAMILGYIREQVVRAIQESRFQPALEMLSGYTMTKPKVIIGTDVVIANWIEKSADKRTLGDQFDYEVVTTADNRWRGRVQWFFKVSDGQNGLNPLNFGNHLWVPELITDTNLTRNEGTANEVTVQPRNTHIVNCPITGVLIIEGITEYVQSKPSTIIESVQALASDSSGDLVLGDLAGN